MKSGLRSAEVEERIRQGLVNGAEEPASRTYGEIVRANTATLFNAILGTLLVLILIFGSLPDALFGIVLVANTLIGIVQEVRAKRILDRLAVLNAPRANVRRDGRTLEISVDKIVLDDLMELKSGDQIAVDGRVATSENLEIDESLLTGESAPVHKKEGDEVRSGSFVTAGTGSATVSEVGANTYARQLTREARRFGLTHSELLAGINRFLRYVVWAMVVVAPFLFFTQLRAAAGSLRALLPLTVAGLVGMVPQGLVLLTTIVFAVSAIRLGRRRTLIQELPAVEGLARVDVVCFDKTGTITKSELAFHGLEAINGRGEREAEEALSVFGDAASPNATTRALAAAFPHADHRSGRMIVPFSSERKWSAASVNGKSAWVLGAPEVVLPEAVLQESPASRGALLKAAELADAGFRVLLLASTKEAVASARVPENLSPAALVLFEEQIREDAPATIRYFAGQGVALKIISGDNPKTVAAACARAGLLDFGEAVDARNLPRDPAELGVFMEDYSVFGRASPEQKRDMIRALQSRGHIVAMNGDGVNDVLALKAADLGVAMGNGAPATKAVAQVVLLDSQFSTLPLIVAEGRAIIGNIERVANLFLTKTAYIAVVEVGVGAFSWPFPFLPRHLTLIDALTIGIPAFFLALAPNVRRYRPGFTRRVLRFVIPSGFLAAIATLTAYGAARVHGSASPNQASTAAFLALIIMGFWILWLLAKPLTSRKGALLGAMAASLIAVMLWPPARSFFALELLTPVMYAETLAIAAISIGVLNVL